MERTYERWPCEERNGEGRPDVSCRVLFGAE